MNTTEKNRLCGWRHQSTDASGFQTIVAPETSECKYVQVFRLNLSSKESYQLSSKELELHPVLIEGKAIVSGCLEQELNRFDSFYMPANNTAVITAVEDCCFYIAGAKCEGLGEVSIRKYEKDLPLGDIHQIHGVGVGQREVMFTLDPNTKASRLICGLTWGATGAWTSWPPHQHEKDLEEVYCYFDMPRPKFGFHLSYLNSGDPDGIVVHTVNSGTMVEAPCGYHPTVASPTVQNTYLWVLAALTPESRRYDLAVLDPDYKNY